MEEEQKKVSGAAVLPKVGWKGMLALAFGILFFAGVFTTIQGAEWLKAFDYSTLIGKFGTMKDPAKATFVGMGGVAQEEDLFLPYRSFLLLCWPLVL